MRTLLLVALAAAVCTASASAGHSNGTGPKNDLATGAGKFATRPAAFFSAMEFSFSAHRTTSGIHGNVNFRGVNNVTGEEMNGHGSIVCFDVRDNRAFVAFEFHGDRPFGENVEFGQLTVEDNGEPGDPVPDRALALGLVGGGGEPPPVPPRECLTVADVDFAATLPLESGNVTVHEGTD